MRQIARQLRSLLEALLVAFVIITFGVNTVGISGHSMQPTLHHGERALVPKFETWLHRAGIGQFQRGDIVYFRPPEDVPGVSTQRIPLLDIEYRPFFIKRIIGLPGDHIVIERGVVYVNNEPLDEAYLGPLGNSSFPETIVPDDHVFVLGDNRMPLGSVDSRRFGPVALSEIAGRAQSVIWPLITRDEHGEWQWNARRLYPPGGYNGDTDRNAERF